MAGVQANIRQFIAQPKGPGRTAPSLLENICLFDPRTLNAENANVLLDQCLDHVAYAQFGQHLPDGTCRHAFITKSKQSSPPVLEERPGPSSVYIVAAICRHCRAHVLLKVDYSIGWRERPCPNGDNPLHHLVRNEWQENIAKHEWASKSWGSPDHTYVFGCSSSTCSATVSVRIKLPILNTQDVHNLVDKETLKRRTDEAFRIKGAHVEGMRHPTSMDVLVDLRQYLRNAWTKEPRPIAIDNKRFIVRFGPEGSACHDVLEKLGFTLRPHECWEAPKPNLDDKEPLQDSRNSFMDDAEHELSVLILQRPKEERQLLQESPVIQDASRDFERALGCQDYDKALAYRLTVVDPTLRPTPYTGLGIPEDAADRLIIFAYEKQKQTDSAQTPWYLSYLKSIGQARNSETLQTHIATELSAGRFDAEQLTGAYAYFGLSLHGQQTDDEHIIGIFQSRLQDARIHESEMRERLSVIGEHRQSRRIIDFASDIMNTYDQALSFLGADATTPDEFIESLYATRTAEDVTLTERARKAVKMIADHRKSTALETWLKTGKMGETKMDPAEAYSTLQIPDRTTTDDMVLSAYQVAISDNSANVEYYNKALHTIAKDRNSNMLLQTLSGQKISTPEGSADTPVGLENIGNTCYLNSLLQFFFTLPELRNIVLDFDKYKMDISAINMAKKQVGRRPVTVQEVQTAQKFVASLASLFREMISSPKASITPQQELARLTLESEDAKQKIKRRSTIASGGRPSLGHIDTMPIHGPLLPPHIEASEDVLMSPVELRENGGKQLGDVATGHEAPEEVKGSNRSSFEDVKMRGTSNSSSEATLVSRPSSADEPLITPDTRDQQQELLQSKENYFTKGTQSPKRLRSPVKSQPLGELSASELNTQAGLLGQTSKEQDSTAIPGESHYSVSHADQKSSKPPPIPPRPQQPMSITALEEYARQQDVTEVISHCLFQLSCAMRPSGIDKDGEQLDEIHDLLYGQSRYHDVPEKAGGNTDEFFSSIITRLYSEPDDIYAALDTAFDLEEVDSGLQRFMSVTRLPPVFAIQLDRVSFEPRTQSYKKLNHHVDLRETIFLDRYLEDAPGSAQRERRKQTWEWKKELIQKLERQRELGPINGKRPEVSQTLEDARVVFETLQKVLVTDEDEVEEISITSESIDTLDILSQQSRKELAELNQRCKDLRQMVKSNFTDMRQHAYRLHAAFFHRGTQGSGHYWIYIYDALQEIWRKYNDGYVTKVENTNEIFARPPESEFKTWSGPANPYLLIYVKADEQSRLVESVHRDIVYQSPNDPPLQETQTKDAEMENQTGVSGEQQPLYDPPPYAPPPRSTHGLGEWDSSESIVADQIKW